MSTLDEDWLERIWEYREEVLYPSLFGTEFEGIFPMPMEQAGDPRWATCGVIRFAPTVVRDSWLYVSSGLSNAWFDDAPDREGTSGFGCEFLIETAEKVDWPIIRLHQIMKYQIDICCGKYSGAEPLSDHHRIPIGGSIDLKNSKLTHVVLAEPVNAPRSFQQDSGTADFYLIFGITEHEKTFGKDHGAEALLRRLREQTSFPITNPIRESIKTQ